MKWILILTILVIVACAFLFRASALRAQGDAGKYPALSPAEARDLIGKRSGDPGFVLLDVRTRKEFDAERIAGSVIVDYNSPSFREEMAKLDRGRTYLVYCRTGNRTNGAARVMRELGFPDVILFPGGITEWKAAGFPTTR
jgi:phage shock protein E